MNAEQKSAWMGVISMAVCVVVFLALLPFFGPKVSFAAFALFAVNGFSFKAKEKPDERDKAIVRRAALFGFSASYGAFCLGCMGTWFTVFTFRGDESVSVHVFPMIAIIGLITLLFIRSVAILVLYGRAVEADDA